MIVRSCDGCRPVAPVDAGADQRCGRRDSVSRATARHIARCAMRRRTHNCRFCDWPHPPPRQLVDITVFNHCARALRPRAGWRGLHRPVNRGNPSRGPCTQLVRDYFETFHAQAAHWRDGQGLPRVVEQAAVARSATASLAEALAEAGVPRLPDVRMSGGGLRAVPVFGLPTRSACPVLLQGARILPELRWAPHDRSCRALGRPRISRRTHQPVPGWSGS